MRRDDRALYEAGVAALSECSRYLRFASPLPRLSGRLLDQLMDLDEHRHVAYAALTPDERRLLGVARYVRLEHAPDTTAEVAITVADSWQGVGVGTLLLDRLIAHARYGGVGSLVAVTLGENHAAKALARKAGFAARRETGIYTNLRLEVRRPSRPEPDSAEALRPVEGRNAGPAREGDGAPGRLLDMVPERTATERD